MAVVLTKLRPQGHTASFIERRRLLDRVDDVRQTQFALVQAPAGYGKSCLLYQWFNALREQKANTAWLSLDTGQRDALEFLAYVISALQLDGHYASPFLDQVINREVYLSADIIAAEIANSFDAAAAPMFLFIDDAHHLIGSEAARCLRILMESAPHRLHIVIATREKLDIHQARLRALGQLVEVGASDLRFCGDEVTALLSSEGHGDLGPEELETIEKRTEGWAVGLKLAGLALRSAPNRMRLLETFSGERTEIWDFFAEDVLNYQPEAVQSFMIRVSMLDRLCPALCDAVTGRRDGHKMLDVCEKSGLFLQATDANRSWHRFHHLFREFLHRSLLEHSPEAVPDLHRRASDWLDAEGHYIEAFDHAMKAGDPVRAANILDRHYDDMFSAGQARTIRRLADQIPPHVQAFYPRIMLAAAWPMIVNWKFEPAKSLLAASRARLDETKRNPDADATEIASLEYLLAHREMMLAQTQDDMLQVEQRCEALLRSDLEPHPFVRGSTYSALANSRRAQFKLQDIDRLDVCAREYLGQCGSQQVFILHDVVMGCARFLMGRTEAAASLFRTALDTTIRLSGRGATLGAASALPLAEICYERNELEDAAALVEEYLPIATEHGFVDQLIAGHRVNARLLWISERRDETLQTLEEGASVAVRIGFRRLELNMAAERMHYLLRMGRPEEAIAIATEAGVRRRAEPPLPTGRISSTDEARARVWLHWYQARNEIAEALALARQWRSHLSHLGALKQVIRWDIQLAKLAFLKGETLAAQRTLRRALAIAGPARFIRSFLDEETLMKALVPEGVSGADDGSDPAARYASELSCLMANSARSFNLGNHDWRGAEPSGLSGPLHSKELEILRLVGIGLRNSEIGARLGMTEGTVKWYLQQVYDKVGVRRRKQAFQVARDMGLLG